MFISPRSIAFLVSLFLVAAIPSGALALIELVDIDGPAHCPEGLTIKCKPVKDGMIQFDVLIDPEQVAHADVMYKGRVKSHAMLKVASGQEQIASAVVAGSPKGNQTWYQFTLSPAAAKSSELQLGVSLFEKDGHATIGGGVSMRIKLGGFEPAEPDRTNP